MNVLAVSPRQSPPVLLSGPTVRCLWLSSGILTLSRLETRRVEHWLRPFPELSSSSLVPPGIPSKIPFSHCTLWGKAGSLGPVKSCTYSILTSLCSSGNPLVFHIVSGALWSFSGSAYCSEPKEVNPRPRLETAQLPPMFAGRLGASPSTSWESVRVVMATL